MQPGSSTGDAVRCRGPALSSIHTLRYCPRNMARLDVGGRCPAHSVRCKNDREHNTIQGEPQPDSIFAWPELCDGAAVASWQAATAPKPPRPLEHTQSLNWSPLWSPEESPPTGEGPRARAQGRRGEARRLTMSGVDQILLIERTDPPLPVDEHGLPHLDYLGICDRCGLYLPVGEVPGATLCLCRRQHVSAPPDRIPQPLLLRQPCTVRACADGHSTIHIAQAFQQISVRLRAFACVHESGCV